MIGTDGEQVMTVETAMWSVAKCIRAPSCSLVGGDHGVFTSGDACAISAMNGFTGEESVQPKKVHEPSIVELDEWVEALKVTGHQRLTQRGWLGKGGMGIVDLVQDSVLHRDLARKTLTPDGHDNHQLVRLFAREACIMAQLPHPGIIPIHDIGTDAKGHLYFTMKAVQGQTLRQIVKRRPREFDRGRLLDTIEVLSKVCDALSFAHQSGVVHCDVKPDNIMLGSYGEVYLMDWGLARIIGKDNSILDQVNASEPTTSNASETDYMVMGTPSYMAPEQARGERYLVDVRTDVYAMGAVLYYALTGQAPHKASNNKERLRLAKTTPPTPPSELVEGIPPFIEDIAMNAMSFDMEARPSSIMAFKKELKDFVRDGSDFPSRRFAAGEVIIEEGTVGDTAYFIESGRCEVRRMIDGQPQAVRIMEAGEGFGESSILTRRPRSATVVALEPSLRRCIDRQRMESELDGMRPWMRSFMSTLATRFREL